MSKSMHIVMVGGGSGGHFYPLMSIAEALNATSNSPKLYYMGPSSYDEAALQAQQITYTWCPAGKRRKYASAQNFFDMFKTGFGLVIAIIKLYFIYPDVVVSKGGYTSVPVVLAAAFLNIPIIVHESDSVPGAANKLAAKFARFVGVAYQDTVQKFPEGKAALVGIPIRTALLSPASPNGRAELGITNDLPIIVVLGGSQGAERVNQLILNSLDELLPDFNIIHQTGAATFALTTLSARELITNPDLLDRYHPVAFMDAPVLNQALWAASFVISRAGSTSIYEISLHGKPSILIPIPEEISHDQRQNAYTYANASGAIVMEEHNLTDGLLRAEIDRIMQDAPLYESMATGAAAFGRSDAAASLAQIVIQTANEH